MLNFPIIHIAIPVYVQLVLLIFLFFASIIFIFLFVVLLLDGIILLESYILPIRNMSHLFFIRLQKDYAVILMIFFLMNLLVCLQESIQH